MPPEASKSKTAAPGASFDRSSLQVATGEVSPQLSIHAATPARQRLRAACLSRQRQVRSSVIPTPKRHGRARVAKAMAPPPPPRLKRSHRWSPPVGDEQPPGGPIVPCGVVTTRGLHLLCCCRTLLSPHHQSDLTSTKAPPPLFLRSSCCSA
jgi:hypothetical protein